MINNMNIVQYVNMIHMYREIVNYFFSQHYESKIIISYLSAELQT